MKISKQVLANVAKFCGQDDLERCREYPWRGYYKFIKNDTYGHCYCINNLLALLKSRLRRRGHTFLTASRSGKKYWEVWIRGWETMTGKTELAAVMFSISAMMEDGK